MKYNFETIGKRYHTGSKKWNELLANGVREDEDIIPFSVADMEFETTPEIVAAIKEEVEHYVLGYAGEIENAVLVIHGEKAHSCYFSKDAFAKLTGDNKELLLIPGAVHTDLYDRLDVIPFDKIESFFNRYLK